MKRYYGWKKQLPDPRDKKFLFMPDPSIVLPPSIDLRPFCPPVYDQGQLGSCTANGIAFAYEFDHMKQQLPDFMPSRLFIYYNERVIEKTVKSDSGACIRDGFKTMGIGEKGQGVCPETDWPYNINRFACKPPKKCYNEAKKDVALKYRPVNQILSDIKSSLAQGFPVVIGMSVFESFESDEVKRTGIVPMPGINESVLGGHCMAVVGYDDIKGWWIVRNSWGTKWGDQGYCYIPYQYLTDKNLSDDFWQMSLVA
jgi:C1A family cysteine protease